MNILVLGSGGREHSLCWSILKSRKCKKVFCIPGNGGISEIVECIDVKPSKKKILSFCLQKDIDLVVIGPEKFLEMGLADYLIKKNILVFGPEKKAAKLESSKIFSKQFLKRNNIPTATYKSFSNSSKAIDYIKENNPPFVIKVNGLAEGKGVIISENRRHAIKNIKEIIDKKKFGSSGNKIIIEEFLNGFEVSYFAFVDKNTILPFSYALDHKRANDNDKGLNTGGMGAFTPSEKITKNLQKRILNEIILPTKRGLDKQDIIFRGILFFGLMITNNGPKVIEYNVRFGDPECQVILRNLKSDLLNILLASGTDSLSKQKIKIFKRYSICVVLASRGYPKKYKANCKIENIDKIKNIKNIEIFHSGTKKIDDSFFSCGGRVLGVSSIGKTISEARLNAYNVLEKINWKKGFYRKDIGKKNFK